jgi:hypothetical protein
LTLTQFFNIVYFTLNHQKTESFVLRTTEDVVVPGGGGEGDGIELFLHYGTFDASKIFTTYGFAPDDVAKWSATFLVAKKKKKTIDLSARSAAFHLTNEIDDQAVQLVHHFCKDTSFQTPTIRESLQSLYDAVNSHISFPNIERMKDAVPHYSLEQGEKYRTGELRVLEYWKNLVRMSVLSTSMVKRAASVGETKYYLHGNDFRIVRIVGATRVEEEGGEEEEEEVLYDVMFQSGTRVRNVKRGDLLDEYRYLQYLCSLR